MNYLLVSGMMDEVIKAACSPNLQDWVTAWASLVHSGILCSLSLFARRNNICIPVIKAWVRKSSEGLPFGKTAYYFFTSVVHFVAILACPTTIIMARLRPLWDANALLYCDERWEPSVFCNVLLSIFVPFLVSPGGFLPKRWDHLPGHFFCNNILSNEW